MAGERKYTRIPPESTGDRIYMVHTAIINYDGKDVSHTWKVGDRYTISGNGGQTFTFHLHGVYEINSTTGRLYVHYSEQAREEGYVASNDQSIQYDTDNDGNLDVVATVSFDATDLYIPTQNIMGYDNPEYGLNIDLFGSAQVTFKEGPPQATGMGLLKVSDPLLLASYDFSKSNLPTQFVNSREGGSDVSNTWDPTVRGVKLAVGTTQGDRVTQTSNLFHSYEEGASLLFVMSARAGDSGKEFVTRLWGAFDATDGFFFQIKGSDDAPGGRATPTDPIGTGPGSALRVVHRFTFNGVTSNHEILQKEWNKDTLLGTGGGSNPSGMLLDFSKINTYWIDYQFIGGGRTRWGVFYQGNRIVCHEMYHHNGIGVGTQFSHPISNANRPVCWAMANYGTSASASEFYAFGAGVYIETTTDPLKAAQPVSIDVQTKMWGVPESQPYWRTKQSRNGSNTAFPTLLKSGSYSSSSSTQYQMTLSPNQFLLNPDGTEGDENHTIYQPLIFDISNYNISDGSKKLSEARVFYGCIMRGVEYKGNLPSTPSVSYDLDGDHLAHVIELGRSTVDGNLIFDYSKLTDNEQYGTVNNTSDQNLARALQPLTKWTSTSDKYTTGNQRVLVTVGPDPRYGESKFSIFADKQPIVIREYDGDQDVATVLGTTFTGKTAGGAGYASVDKQDNPNDWHYLSLVARNEAWLYNSIADIDDDRLTRVLTVDDCGGLDLGQKLTVTAGSHTAFILKIDVDTAGAIAAGSTAGATEYQIVTRGTTDFTAIGAPDNNPGTIFTASGAGAGTGTVVATSGTSGTVAICGRSSSDISYYNGVNNAFTTDGGGAGDITAITTDADIAKDYWTSINALEYDVDLGMGADVDLSNTTAPAYTGLALYGGPHPRAAWTFMIKHRDNTNEDDDGDIGPTYENSRNNWNIFWRQREQ
jgi:hypothetical protein